LYIEVQTIVNTTACLRHVRISQLAATKRYDNLGAYSKCWDSFKSRRNKFWTPQRA